MTTTMPEMVQVGSSGVPRWLWDALGQFDESLRAAYFAGRGLQVYYEGAGAGPAFLEERVSVEAWAQAITAWASSWTGRGQRVELVAAAGPVSEALATELSVEAQLDQDALRLDVDSPSPAVFVVSAWDVDWWDPALNIEVGVDFEAAPTVESVREAMILAQGMGAEVMVPGLIEATGRTDGPGLRLSAEGLVVRDVAGQVAGQVSAVLGREPDTWPDAAARFVPDHELSEQLVCWSWC